MKLTALLLLAAAARAQSPAPAEQTAILDRVRSAALGFADQLRDFTCIQTNIRTVDRSGHGHWKPLDTQEIELTYAAHKEHYKVLTINGKPVERSKGVKPGYFTAGGEFGSAFRKIFEPKAAAKFEWDRMDASAGKPVCVFRYRVPLETTTLVMTADLDTVPMSHRGFVEADCDSGVVTHIHIQTDPAYVHRNGRDVLVGSTIDVRYGPVTIAGREFFAPLVAEETVPFGPTLTRVQIKFERYRKYESSSSVTFGDPKP